MLPLFSWRPTYQGCVFPLLSPTGPTINYNALLFVLPPFVGQGSRGGSFPAQRIMGISWKGGGVKTFTSTPPPWTLSAWRHPPSGKLKNTPTLERSQAPPLWTLSVWRHPHSKGGGVIIPVTPPLDPPLQCRPTLFALVTSQSVTLYIVTLCGYITSSAVLWCEGRKEPRHGSLRIILLDLGLIGNTEYIYLQIRTTWSFPP